MVAINFAKKDYKTETIPLLPPFWPNLHLLLNLSLHLEYNTITPLHLLLASFLHSACIVICSHFVCTLCKAGEKVGLLRRQQQVAFTATVNVSLFSCWLWRWELFFFCCIILASSRAEPVVILFLTHEWLLSNAVQSLCKPDQLQRWSDCSSHTLIAFVCISTFH